jgi:hypothetical protein
MKPAVVLSSPTGDGLTDSSLTDSGKTEVSGASACEFNAKAIKQRMLTTIAEFRIFQTDV